MSFLIMASAIEASAIEASAIEPQTIEPRASVLQRRVAVATRAAVRT
ncbi:hypothetical protein RAS2_04880 [Phycisphaerae bacterium RAS2]|nr:hypothetical protein RAS2_04880 [Phycisphaerae bacterium RAS2]